ncbi:tRNA (adenosine(37)-N6)-threonylcarbamoyltransferase complex ATPase subunit type 1 TsaE [Actibacterium sp. XHP0104]|uniref:tRNA (adenosine(37)-N6)-threonylcarbamoyltransferase complex ATPase subunit type 1 TsaE n=1 Tax=Actibacterium sp. XHP0104 TaxID=2984335 RepID=UPI0021E99BCC|nr:tRNA (adenosine(37)-N6)-threonylcarbamoyltransferase complex ATPase subunit type 1 TsaE [Actibacterium sp. XHP0104]MCV2882123.1 tRNA (adenosine(37)-N6)-threonylcarbamoyltransferase complex ATPase subunit type 1 TsaE [Actibacterium sp. XHP0104]
MTAAFAHSLTLPLPEDTAALAACIAPRLGPGDVLLLQGPIGAGKTHFARSLIQHLLAQADAFEDVPSPTFTLVQTYEAGDLEIWHADLYRLSHPDDVIELGLIDAFESALCLVEWPDRLADLTPPGALVLGFAANADDSRALTIASDDPRWAATLKGCLDDTA